MTPSVAPLGALIYITCTIFLYVSANTHATVKRHHSAGDMLDDAQYNGTDDQRSGRPRSEGHTYLQTFAQKRASSYGVILIYNFD